LRFFSIVAFFPAKTLLRIFSIVAYFPAENIVAYFLNCCVFSRRKHCCVFSQLDDVSRYTPTYWVRPTLGCRVQLSTFFLYWLVLSYLLVSLLYGDGL
jgi:hypothetical protein